MFTFLSLEERIRVSQINMDKVELIQHDSIKYKISAWDYQTLYL